MPEIYVEDDTHEVFWTYWVDGNKTIVMLLNTDWTTESNEKKINLVVKGRKQEISVKERDLVVAEIVEGNVKTERFSF